MTAPGVMPKGWDDWLATVGGEASFTQTSHWAQIHEAVNGVRPFWVEMATEGHRVCGALFGLRRNKIRSPADLVVRALHGFDGGVLECAGGPVIAGGEASGMLSGLLQRTTDLARRLRARSVIFSNPPSTASWTSDSRAIEAFRASGYSCTPWETGLVDIARSDDDLLASFRQSARKGIRKCQELGVVVRACRDSADYLENFSRPLFATRKVLGMGDDPAAAERHWWDHDLGRYYRYFLAQDKDGRILGTLGTYRWNGVVTEIMSERTMPARDSNIPVQDLLHWHAFITHRELGDRVFDLAGFAPAPSTEKEKGIRAFKEKWQGRTVMIPRYERHDLSLPMRMAKHTKRKLAEASTPARNDR